LKDFDGVAGYLGRGVLDGGRDFPVGVVVVVVIIFSTSEHCLIAQTSFISIQYSP